MWEGCLFQSFAGVSSSAAFVGFGVRIYSRKVEDVRDSKGIWELCGDD